MTNSGVQAFETVYQEMEATRVGPGTIQRRVSSTEHADVVAFLHTESGLRGATFEFKDQLSSVSTLDKVRGLTIVVTDSGVEQRITIEQARPGDGQLFSIVIESILATFGESPGEEARALAEKLIRWRGFFSRESEGLSNEEQLGLFAEIHVLRKIAKTMGTPVGAIKFWEGPHSEVHDFSQSDWALEVKATSSLGSGLATISSERQLDPSSVAKLYLAFFSFDVRPTGPSATLPYAISRLRRELAAFPSSADHFEDLLIEAGYHDIHSKFYSAHYTPVREDGYLVGEEFPSIKVDQLSNAVSRVRYVLNTDLCQEWKMPLEEVLGELVSSSNAN